MENGVVAERQYEEQDDPFGEMPPLPAERSAPHELVREFVSEEGIEGKTNLSKRQVAAFTRLDIFDLDFPEFEVGRLKKYMLLKISEKGKSREGLLDMLKGNRILEQPHPQELNRGRF